MAELDAIQVDVNNNNTVTGTTAAAASPTDWRDIALRDWVEDEVLQFFPLVQAAQDSNNSDSIAPIKFPASLHDAKMMLKKLGCDLTNGDPFLLLGFARLEGPDPAVISIGARGRTAKTILAMHAQWPEEDKSEAISLIARLVQATSETVDGLPELMSIRRKLRVPKLDPYNEVGLGAVRAIAANTPSDSVILMQWSNILGVSHPRLGSLGDARKLGALLEKGDERWLDMGAGKKIIVWAPADANALSRCYAAYLRRADPQARPASLVMVATFPAAPGYNTVETISDICPNISPFLLERWSPIVRGVAYMPFPFELAGTSQSTTPRHYTGGLALFSLQHSGPINIPKIINIESVISVDPVQVVTFDMRSSFLTEFVKLAGVAEAGNIKIRMHRRSPTNSKEVPRVAVDVLMDSQGSALEQVAFLKTLRRRHLPDDAFYAFRHIISANDSLILEGAGPGLHVKYWKLCSQMYPLSNSRLLLCTDATAETWTEVMAKDYADDPAHSATRLRCRASYNGGRTVATPAATTTQISASRRRSGKTRSTSDLTAEVRIRGEVGHDDTAILDKLMSHVCGATGLQFQRAADIDNPRAGEYIHCVSPAIPAGTLKVLARAPDDIRRLYAALHGQSILVGADHVAIEVINDLINIQAGTGEDSRAQ